MHSINLRTVKLHDLFPKHLVCPYLLFSLPAQRQKLLRMSGFSSARECHCYNVDQVINAMHT